MKINQWISLLIFTAFSISGSSSLYAAAEQRHEVSEAVTKKIKTPKKGIFKKWIENRVAKKMDKITNSDGIKSSSTAALIIGILSIVGMILGIFALAVSGSAVLLLLAGILAIVGDTLGIISLVKIKKSDDPESYKKERNKAVAGLVMSLLTGLIPLTILLVVLVAFATQN